MIGTLEEVINVTLKSEGFNKFLADLKVIRDAMVKTQRMVATEAIKVGRSMANSVLGKQAELRKVSKRMKKDLEQVGFERIAKRADSFFGVLGLGVEHWSEINKRQIEFKSLGGKSANLFRQLTHGLKGFRMEMLGVMFFGMMMQRFFMGLLKPVMDIYGIFDLWRITLQVYFLPVMETLMPILLNFMLWLMNASPATKEFVGWMVVAGVIIGGFLFIIGSLALGIGSVILALSPLGLGLIKVGSVGVWLKGIFTSLRTTFSGLGVGVGIVAAVIVAVIIGMVIAWRENFANMRDWVRAIWESIKQILLSAWKVISGVVKLIVAIFTGDFEGAKNAIKQIWAGVVNIIVGALKFIYSVVVSIGIGVFRVLVGVYTIIYRGFQWVFDKIETFFKEWLPKAWQFGVDIIKGIIDGMKSVGHKISNYIKSIIPGGSDGSESSGTIAEHNDFIWRPGQKPISISPQDTLIGAKSGTIGGANGASINNTFNVQVADRVEFERMLNDFAKGILSEVERLVTR